MCISKNIHRQRGRYSKRFVEKIKKCLFLSCVKDGKLLFLIAAEEEKDKWMRNIASVARQPNDLYWNRFM